MNATPTHSAPVQPNSADRPNEYDPTYSLNRLIAKARQEMGEAVWARLNEEWGE